MNMPLYRMVTTLIICLLVLSLHLLCLFSLPYICYHCHYYHFITRLLWYRWVLFDAKNAHYHLATCSDVTIIANILYRGYVYWCDYNIWGHLREIAIYYHDFQRFSSEAKRYEAFSSFHIMLLRHRFIILSYAIILIPLSLSFHIAITYDYFIIIIVTYYHSVNTLLSPATHLYYAYHIIFYITFVVSIFTTS